MLRLLSVFIGGFTVHNSSECFVTPILHYSVPSVCKWSDWVSALVFADCESYCKPVKGNLKINMKKYCKKDYGKRKEVIVGIVKCSFTSSDSLVFSAVQVNVLDMETVGDWAKFSVSIVSVYKSRGEPLKRGDNILWVHLKDLACKCPKIQMSKRFLVMGGSEGGTGTGTGPGVGPGGGATATAAERIGLVADKNSLVIQWRDVWTRRLRKFQRKEKKGKCSKAWWESSVRPYLSLHHTPSWTVDFFSPRIILLLLHRGNTANYKDCMYPTTFCVYCIIIFIFQVLSLWCHFLSFCPLVCLKKGPLKRVWSVDKSRHLPSPYDNSGNVHSSNHNLQLRPLPLCLSPSINDCTLQRIIFHSVCHFRNWLTSATRQAARLQLDHLLFHYGNNFDQQAGPPDNLWWNGPTFSRSL